MQKEISSQFKASLNMLKDAVDKCPVLLWDNKEYGNIFWRIVYHTLFYTHFYLSTSSEDFIPWEKHKKGYNYLSDITSDNEAVLIETAYSKEDLLNYMEYIQNNLDGFINNAALSSESGFYWLPFTRFELHLYNIRHIQHHTGQLTERLRENGINGFEWKSQGKGE